MDEDMDTSVDTADVDTSDIDTSPDIDTSEVSEDIPEDIPEDVPEDNYLDNDNNDIDEEIPEDTEEDDLGSEIEDGAEDVPEDVGDESVEEADDLPDEVPEDTFDEDALESDDTSDEIEEDIESDDLTDTDDDLPDEIPEDIPDVDETEDIDSDTTNMEVKEQPADTDEAVTDESKDAACEETDTTADEQPDETEEPVEDETKDTISDITDTETDDQLADTDEAVADEVEDTVSEETDSAADEQLADTDETATAKADDTPSDATDMETNEETADDWTDLTEVATIDEADKDVTGIDSGEYPGKKAPQQYRKASSTTPDEMPEIWSGIDPKSMPQNKSTQFDEKLNELVESDLPSEEKRQILEDLKEDIQTQKESMASETDDGQDDGAPVKMLKKDGGDTSISRHDYEKELADLDEGIKNRGLMQEDIARDLAADNERILNDNSLSEVEKREQLALNEQKRQLLGQQYDAELSELQREREALAAKIDGNSIHRGEPSSPAKTQSNQKMADGSEQGNDDYETQARSALRPTDAAFASEDTRSPLSDLQNINRQQLANYNQAEVNDSLPFEKNNIMETNNRLCDIEMQNGLKLEDFSKSEFEKLQRDNPMAANKLMTEFVDRKSPAVDVNAPALTENGRELRLTDSTYAITDEPCSKESASMKNLSTGKEYTVYPNPLSRISPYDIKQGNNSLGMKQDCGLASGSEAINGLYGKRIVSEEYNTDLANKLENFEYAYKPLRDNEGKVMRNEFGDPLFSDEIDWENSGGTNEQNVKRMFDSYNISSEAFSGRRTPNPEYLAESLKTGDNVIAAVNSDLFWNEGDPRDNPEFLSRMNDSDAQLWKEGKCYADHFVNVYAACYDKETGDLTGFMVKDTGAGKDGMVSLDHFKRAFNGDDRFTVMAQGCVVGRKRGSK